LYVGALVPIPTNPSVPVSTKKVLDIEAYPPTSKFEDTGVAS